MLMLNSATSFDFIVMVLMTIKLVKHPCRSSLWHLLFRQGIIYFLVAFLANLLPATFGLLNLNGKYFFLPPNLRINAYKQHSHFVTIKI